MDWTENLATWECGIISNWQPVQGVLHTFQLLKTGDEHQATEVSPEGRDLVYQDTAPGHTAKEQLLESISSKYNFVFNSKCSVKHLMDVWDKLPSSAWRITLQTRRVCSEDQDEAQCEAGSRNQSWVEHLNNGLKVECYCIIIFVK